MEKEVKDLVEATAPRTEIPKNTFTDLQVDAFNSKYIDSYDEALDLLEKRDITVSKGKYKWKDR